MSPSRSTQGNPPPPADADARDQLPIDPHVWKASAGKRVNILDVGSMVYYFPQGHVEQASSPPDFSMVPRTKPYVPCRVLAVQLLADHQTDEVFTRVFLDPTLQIPPPKNPTAVSGDDDAAKAYPKVLTPSDANNGGGFSVPRHCAESVFPPLDLDSEMPFQTLKTRDLIGNEWSFRHVYRGTPRRHLLTTGWSKFVNAKNLVAGDTIVFFKSSADEVFIGIRRKAVNRGRVAAERVVEAVRAADAGDRVFEVEYYPRQRSTEFLVMEETVAAAMKVPWVPGIKVKMSVRHDDDDRVSLHRGEVEATTLVPDGPWALSPWRMLKVKWEEPELVRDKRNMSPWQVEVLPGIHQIETSSVLAKCELRAPMNSSNGTGNTTMCYLPSSLLSHTAPPAGMQGARQESDDGYSSTMHLRSENTVGSDSAPESADIADRERSSPTSPLPPGEEEDRTLKRTKYIQLFGRVIEVEHPLESDAAAAQSDESSAVLLTGEASTTTSPASQRKQAH